MTESEYLDASNLARIRAAASVLTDCTLMDESEAEVLHSATSRLWVLVDKLQLRIQTEDE